jgi:AMP nucleosidase
MMTGVTISTDFSAVPETRRPEKVKQLLAAMEAADAEGHYPKLIVERPWSVHNRVLEGEFASPRAIRWYLERELGRLAAAGARMSVCRGRRAVDLHDVDLVAAVDETRWDLRRKKLFLFAPERMALSIDRLRHYTGTAAEEFQRYVLLTNYAWHVEEFRDALRLTTGPESDGRQMPAWHYAQPDRAGLTMINIGVGPSNAKTITDHLAVLRPDLVLMIGHCAGLRNRQEIGDLVLATAYMRDDRVLDDVLPLSVPVVPNYTLNTLLLDELTSRRLRSRMGIVFTTANRNWGAAVRHRRRPPGAIPGPRGGHGVGDGCRQRIPLPDTHRDAARRQRQTPARPAQAERRRAGLLRGHPPPARRDRDRHGGARQAAVPGRAAHCRHPLRRRAAARADRSRAAQRAPPT